MSTITTTQNHLKDKIEHLHHVWRAVNNIRVQMLELNDGIMMHSQDSIEQCNTNDLFVNMQLVKSITQTQLAVAATLATFRSALSQQQKQQQQQQSAKE